MRKTSQNKERCASTTSTTGSAKGWWVLRGSALAESTSAVAVAVARRREREAVDPSGDGQLPGLASGAPSPQSTDLVLPPDGQSPQPFPQSHGKREMMIPGTC